MKAWNYNEIDFDQKMGQKYSTIVQINMKADCRKAIVWWSVSCKIISYHIPDKKLFRFSVCILKSAVYILYLVYILCLVCSLQSASCLTGIIGTNTCVWVNWTFLFFSASMLFFPFVKKIYPSVKGFTFPRTFSSWRKVARDKIVSTLWDAFVNIQNTFRNF